jgi:hypothetical protein
MDAQPHNIAGNAPAPPPAMTDGRYVPTRAIQTAVKGREQEVLAKLEIDWASGNPHICCPYPSHVDKNPSWRWDPEKAQAFCTCIEKSHSIFDVVKAREGLDFEGAKIRVAQLLGLDDLIRRRGGDSQGGYQASDADSLLNVPAESRDDNLPLNYLSRRLGVPIEEVPYPSTSMVGLKELGYYDPPPTRANAKPKLVGTFPCAVFGTVSSDGHTHAHRIYLAPEGAGKADLGAGPDGRPRSPKKSAKIIDGVNRSGCAALWGDPWRAPHIVITEGIETGAAVAYALRDDIETGEVVVAAAISTSGISAFEPYPATARVTIAADRDEAPKGDGKPGSRSGEQAARSFGLKHHERIEIAIALPGAAGESIDWLDLLVRDDVATVRDGIIGADPFEPTQAELDAAAQTQSLAAELAEIAETYPLPEMDNLELVYARTPGGKIKVHKVLGTRTDPVTGAVHQIRLAIATPFGVPARLRHTDQQDAYGLRCMVQDMNGQPRAVDFDRAELAKLNASEIRSKLCAAGLRTEAGGEQIAVESLKAADPPHEIVGYRRPGWHEIAGVADPVFICPSGEVIGGPANIELELVASARLDDDIAASGSLDGWRDAAAAAISVTGCPHWTLGVIAGFVGSLISLTGLDTCGINLSGQSSSGKSTAQRLAVSAWSTPDIRRPGLAQSARATANGLEALAQRATGTVLSLDELALVSGKELAPAVYMIAGGAGKQRMRADATLREGYTWSTFAIFSAECSLEEKIRSEGGEWRAGMAVRIGDIDVAEVNRRVSGQTLRQIHAVTEHYGHAGPAFVRALIEHGLHRQPEALRDRVNVAAGRLAGDDADSAKLRAAIPFALLWVAGELAKAFSLIPGPAAVSDAVRWAWERFQKSSDALALDPEKQALANLRRFIAERWEVSIKSVDAVGPNSRELVGWYDKNTIYIPKERIFEATGQVLKASNVGEMLHRRGLLTHRPEPDRYYARSVPKIGKVASYPLRREEFRWSERLTEPEADIVCKEAADD